MQASPLQLQRLLGYQFNDTSLLEQALTHRSVSSRNNERLEFLGDAILGAVVAEALFQRFVDGSEGDMSRMRASLVKGATLASIGQDLKLGDYLRLGSGELKSGGFRRESILACAVEAVIGAVYLDGGFEASRDLVLRLLANKLAKVSPDSVQKDPKTSLQEHLQGRKLALPEYETVSVSGEPHAQTFVVRCVVPELKVMAEAEGHSRRAAEQRAAEQVLQQLQQQS